MTWVILMAIAAATFMAWACWDANRLLDQIEAHHRTARVHKSVITRRLERW